jgi:muconolactone delta-isomerase
MENTNLQFMVDFTMPKEMPDEFVALIPRQRVAVNRLMNDGKLLNYSLALEHGKLWAVFNVESESELLEIVYDLPLTEFMKVRVSELTFYNAANTFSNVFSVN